MRIVGGKYKGKRIQSVAPQGVRPTSDGVRETMFNILRNYIDIEDCRVLDVCAGTGFLGWEALSRGAKHCTFIEKSRRIADYILSVSQTFNIPNTDFSIFIGDAVKIIKRLSQINDEPYDLIFFDPPYQAGITNDVLLALEESQLLKTGSIIVVEHSSLNMPLEPPDWELLTDRKFGETEVHFFEKK